MAKQSILNPKDELFLWEALRRGEQQALADLFLAQYDTLYRYGLRLRKDQELVKDCIQELFLKLWHKRQSLGKVLKVSPYLCQALRRGIIDALRESHRSLSLWQLEAEAGLEVCFSHEDFLVSQQIDAEQRQHLTNALNQLTKRQREAIHLRYFENFEPGQIAQIMNLSDQAVYNLLYRSVRSLRENFFLLLLIALN